MKNLKLYAISFSISGIFMIPSAFGQGIGWKHEVGQGWGVNSNYNRIFDVKTIETIKGELLSVENCNLSMNKMNMGIGLCGTLKTANKTEINVHFGPSWYISNQEMKINKGDKLEIKGSKVTFNQRPTLFAMEVIKGKDVLKLREENGFPMWSGWRRINK